MLTTTFFDLRFMQLAQDFRVILALLSAPLGLVIVGPSGDVGLTAADDVSFHPVPTTR